MAPGPFAMMRKHWKKSIVYMTVANGSLLYFYDRQMTQDVMKSSCLKAAKWGDQKLKNPTAETRHITVILNPVACKRKSKKLYSKWVEPILHLAGIKVSLIETQSPNQAFDLMKIMSNCDGVAIVGGDGTVNEAINGLLSRPDCSRAVRDFPIGIIPAGQNNSIARYIHQNNISYRNQKEFLIQSTLRLVDCVTENFDALKVTPVESEKQVDEKPIFALRDVRYGKYQDNIFKVSGYMIYQTYIKPIWLRAHSMFSNKYPSPQIESISYTSPCAGCSRCHEKHKLSPHQPNKRWWERKEPKQPDNPECDRWMRVEGISEISDFRATMMGDKMVRLSLTRHGQLSPTDVIEAQDVKLKVKPDEESEFLIDGQQKKAHSIEITTLEKALTIFTGPYYGDPALELHRN